MATASTSVDFIAFEPIRTFSDAMAVRKIRNACRQYMTRDQRWISPWRQWKWWRSKGRPTAFLMYVGKNVVGYGLVRTLNGAAWVSGGLLPKARGEGLGEKLFAWLTEEAMLYSGEVFLEVWEWNKPAISTYTKIGYKFCDQQPCLQLTMKITRKRWLSYLERQ